LELRCRVISNPSLREQRLFLSENCKPAIDELPLFHHEEREQAYDLRSIIVSKPWSISPSVQARLLIEQDEFAQTLAPRGSQQITFSRR
jgi:hypothetical protein